MGKRLTTIVAGVALVALVVLAVVALTTQAGQASAQAGQPDPIAGSAQGGPGGQECVACPGQIESGAAQDPVDGAAPDCAGCGVQQDAGQGGAQSGARSDGPDDGGGCCPY